ncbi:hypothetical protein [Marinilabilia salmonicolor]|uniref:hypothetical protein n=1 Tax=Marinilabilia salmonicolor TaxID=989 RepID=UPI0012F6AC08|nr:hypothetical protein [Marinilabilia salmonicolor]
MFLFSCGFSSRVDEREIFYIDAEMGDDSNDGMSESSPWKTLRNINEYHFTPGTNLLFKRDQEWEGDIYFTSSGTEREPIVIGAYGKGARPRINGNGVIATVFLENCEYITLRDLEITNYDRSDEDGKLLSKWEEENIFVWFNVENPDQYISNNSRRMGIYYLATDIGRIDEVNFLNLEVHGVNGAINQKEEETKNNGGIFIEIAGDKVPTYFDDLLVEDCYIHDVDRTGLSNRSSWSKRSLDSIENWTPSVNYVVRKNVFERAGANALIVRVARKPLIEHNVFFQNGLKASGNAAFSFNTDSALWQYNEASFTKKNKNDEDAGGIDSDYMSKNTIIQYNYLHDNDFGMLVTGGPSYYGGFNDTTIIRYNIFEREGLANQDDGCYFALKIAGLANHTFIYNNVFYLSPEQSDVKMVYHKDWGGYATNTYFFNNISFLEGDRHSLALGESKKNHFCNNLYFGNSTIDWPEDKQGIFKNPLFLKPGTGPEGYRVDENSPVQDAGMNLQLPGIPDTDFFGNQLPEDSRIDIGVHQQK